MAPVFLSAVASACLWLAWRGRGRLWLLPGLAGGGAALLLWARLVGPEFGAIYALGACTIGAWALIGLTATQTGGKVASDRPLYTATPSATVVLRGLGTSVLTGPVALLAVVVACLHLVYWLPAGTATRWVTAAFALPLLWALLTTLLLCTDRRGRAALLLSVLTGLGALVLPSGSLP